MIPLTGSRTLVQKLARQLALNTTIPYRVWFEGQQVYKYLSLIKTHLVYSYLTLHDTCDHVEINKNKIEIKVN